MKQYHTSSSEYLRLEHPERSIAQPEYDRLNERYHQNATQAIEFALTRLTTLHEEDRKTSGQLYGTTAWLHSKSIDLTAKISEPSTLDSINLCNRRFVTYTTEERQRRAVTRIKAKLGCDIGEIFEQWSTATITTLAVGTLSTIEEFVQYLEGQPTREIREQLDLAVNGPLQDRYKASTGLRGTKPTQAKLKAFLQQLKNKDTASSSLDASDTQPANPQRLPQRTAKHLQANYAETQPRKRRKTLDSYPPIENPRPRQPNPSDHFDEDSPSFENPRSRQPDLSHHFDEDSPSIENPRSREPNLSDHFDNDSPSIEDTRSRQPDLSDQSDDDSLLITTPRLRQPNLSDHLSDDSFNSEFNGLRATVQRMGSRRLRAEVPSNETMSIEEHLQLALTASEIKVQDLESTLNNAKLKYQAAATACRRADQHLREALDMSPTTGSQLPGDSLEGLKVYLNKIEGAEVGMVQMRRESEMLASEFHSALEEYIVALSGCEDCGKRTGHIKEALALC
ncbi:hypothetical protein HO173_003330 [Letharia columbiana]|uniref:Uncharacterized protein n=1 Tax=Letharia columbiana TaxID=112416 RepID=A0A8H6G1I0_9LECA|nr:uncharacterized protein HO173_003330 [Letharia columbiana]KAF6238823.1 hypothetical protein HO173_003330 [Letharia columbiana]